MKRLMLTAAVLVAWICNGSFGPLTPSAKPYDRVYIWPEGKMPDVQPHQVTAKTGQQI